MPSYEVDDCPICGDAKMATSELCFGCRQLEKSKTAREKKALAKKEEEDFYRALAEDKAIREAFGEE